jgi:hypothetical protein
MSRLTAAWIYYVTRLASAEPTPTGRGREHLLAADRLDLNCTHAAADAFCIAIVIRSAQSLIASVAWATPDRASPFAG